jgi:Uma2 family endonuclease
MSMSTIAEVQYAIRLLNLEDRRFIACWLEGYQEEDPGFSGVREPVAENADELPYMTEAEYLEFETSSLTRHEYVNGYVHAMSGASMAHNRITTGLYAALDRRLRGGPCAIFLQDLKLMVDIDSEKNYLYPDVMVSCDRDGWKENWLLNPRLIVEVLSPSTQDIDRREKARTYRKIPSVEEYVIARQSSYHLTILRRAENWVAELVNGPEAVAEFRSLGVSIPLAEIYNGVFPEAAARDVGPG